MTKFTQVLIILILIIISITPHAYRNYRFVLANKAISLTLTDKDRAMQIKYAAQLCQENNTNADVDRDSVKYVLEFDNCYLNHLAPLYIITETVRIPAKTMYLTGFSKSSQITNNGASLFGNSSLEVIIYPLFESSHEWTISVETLHDDPPPVILEVWLDETKIGELIYEKADKSWGILSLPLQMDTNFHLLQVKFTNDFRDKDRGIDRNAYIKQVIISSNDFMTGDTNDE